VAEGEAEEDWNEEEAERGGRRSFGLSSRPEASGFDWSYQRELLRERREVRSSAGVGEA
jgi:hypothetical protein